MKKTVVGFVASIFLLGQAFGLLKLNVTTGVDAAIPISVMPFSGAALPVSISEVIANDLKLSGLFKVIPHERYEVFARNPTAWQTQDFSSLGVNDLVKGSVRSLGNDRYQVTFILDDVVNAKNSVKNASGQRMGSALLNQTFRIHASQARQVAHRISDAVYQALTGYSGVFSTRIAYVLKQQDIGHGPVYYLMVADADGFNPKPVLKSSQAIMSPAWSPDNKRLAYVSFENRYSAIYVADVATGKRQLISRFPGINGAPAWSPDGEELALVLSKSGNPNIYFYNFAQKRLQAVTHNKAVNTEPSFSSDGKSMVFTSDRNGSPQIYEMDLLTHSVKRLTYDGAYNAKASFTPDDKSIIFLHNAGSGFTIAQQDLMSGKLTVLANTSSGESPTVAPNGRLVLYVDQVGQGRRLALVSIDSHKVALLPAQGGVQEPAWG